MNRRNLNQADTSITVYIPIYNNAAWRRKLAPRPGFTYVASDNGSDNGSAEILRKKGLARFRRGAIRGRRKTESLSRKCFR